MIRHIVVWNLVPTDPAERTTAFERLKAEFEALLGVVPGLNALTFARDVGTTAGNFDVVLITDHDDEEALAVYQSHPEHVVLAGFVRTVTKDRACVDIRL